MFDTDRRADRAFLNFKAEPGETGPPAPPPHRPLPPPPPHFPSSDARQNPSSGVRHEPSRCDLFILSSESIQTIPPEPGGCQRV